MADVVEPAPEQGPDAKSGASLVGGTDLTKVLTTRLTAVEHKALKALAVEKETSTQALVRGMIQALLKHTTT